MDNENELDALRQKRLAEARGRQEQAEANQEALANLRRGVLPFLDQKASERLDRLRVVDPMKAAKVESYIVQLARAGRINENKKVSEPEILGIMKTIDPKRRETKIMRR